MKTNSDRPCPQDGRRWLRRPECLDGERFRRLKWSLAAASVVATAAFVALLEF